MNRIGVPPLGACGTLDIQPGFCCPRPRSQARTLPREAALGLEPGGWSRVGRWGQSRGERTRVVLDGLGLGAGISTGSAGGWPLLSSKCPPCRPGGTRAVGVLAGLRHSPTLQVSVAVSGSRLLCVTAPPTWSGWQDGGARAPSAVFCASVPRRSLRNWIFVTVGGITVPNTPWQRSMGHHRAGSKPEPSPQHLHPRSTRGRTWVLSLLFPRK